MKDIRLATRGDLPSLAILFDAYRQFYSQSPDLAIATHFLTDRLVQKAWILNDLYIDSTYRKGGVATRLIHSSLDFARETGAAWVSLQTAAANTNAQALYRKIGFKKDACFLNYTYDLNEI